MELAHSWAVTGQTYTRKLDFAVLSALAGVGQSAAKMANEKRRSAKIRSGQVRWRINVSRRAASEWRLSSGLNEV